MRRLLIIAAFAFFGLLVMASPRPALSGSAWAALLNCPDVNADGAVTVGDISQVVSMFGTSYAMNPGQYLLLYDVDGGGQVSAGDIETVVQRFGEECPLIETQVARATLAAIKYRDPAQAIADGYTWGSQDVSQMGIHLENTTFQISFADMGSQLERPVGLVYTEMSPGSNQPDEFIGVWYNVPVQAVCDFYQIEGPCQSDKVQPVGFGETNTDEDNADPAGIQQGWHLHFGLCVWNWGTIDATVAELGPGSEQACMDAGGQIWFSTYGWMMHLYNFIPNPDGRFMLWNPNVP